MLAYTPSQNCCSLSKVYKTSNSMMRMLMYHDSITTTSELFVLYKAKIHIRYSINGRVSVVCYKKSTVSDLPHHAHHGMIMSYEVTKMSIRSHKS